MILKHVLLFSILITFATPTLGEEDEYDEFSSVTALHSRGRFERAIRKGKRRLKINRCCGKTRCGSKTTKDDDTIEEDTLFVNLYETTPKTNKKKSKGKKKSKKKTTEAPAEETTTITVEVTTMAVVVTPAPPPPPVAPVVTTVPPVTTTVTTTTMCSAKCPFCPTPYTSIWQKPNSNSIINGLPGGLSGLPAGFPPSFFAQFSTISPTQPSGSLLLSDPSLGTFINASSCGSMFVMNTNNATFQDAYVRCCTLGLKLWSINKKNLECYLQNMPETPSQPKVDWVWTGGTDQGCPAAVAKYKWCGDSTAFDPLFWSANEPNATQRCASYNYTILEDLKLKGIANVTNGGLKTSSCDLKLSYICAGPITTTPKPYKKVECFYCQKDPCAMTQPDYYSTLNLNGSVMRPERYGVLTSSCGKQYLNYYEQKLTFEAAERKCCEFGMKLVSFDSLENMKCFGNSYIANSRSPAGPLIVWTSGKLMDETCGKNGASKLKWCSTGKLANETWYNIKQTEPDLKCLTYNITISDLENNKFTSVDLNAMDCEETNAFICESITTPAPPPCYRNICPENETCPVDTFQLNNFVKNNLNPSYFRTVKDYSGSCNRTYIATYNDEFDLESSKKLCCKVGLKLLTFETNDERVCFSSFARGFFDTYAYRSTSALEFWTSARSIPGCEGNWQFCPNGDKMLNNQTNWAFQQPDNLNNAEYCLCYSFFGRALLAKDCDCKKQNYVICEGDPTTTTYSPRYSFGSGLGSFGGLSGLGGGSLSISDLTGSGGIINNLPSSIRNQLPPGEFAVGGIGGLPSDTVIGIQRPGSNNVDVMVASNASSTVVAITISAETTTTVQTSPLNY